MTVTIKFASSEFAIICPDPGVCRYAEHAWVQMPDDSSTTHEMPWALCHFMDDALPVLRIGVI